MNRGFVFKTIKGNYYFYNDDNCMVEQSDKNNEEILWGEDCFELRRIDNKETKSILSQIQTKQLILNVTEDCNMRCQYCAYSGGYSNNRTHRKIYMSKDIAIMAVEKYLQSYNEKKKYNILAQPIISFFGGEPLLCFDLIKDVIEYVKLHFDTDVTYTITTNGTLLNKENIKFLVENNIDLSVSLNGDKKEHDRLRIYENEKGTFDVIEKKLQYILTTYPKYYKEKVYFSVVYDTGSDLVELRNFFMQKELVKDKVASFSEVISSFTDWYERYDEKTKNKFYNDSQLLKEIFTSQVFKNEHLETDAILKKLFYDTYFVLLNRVMGRHQRFSILPYTGACIPGNKISVGCNGDLYICEKVNCANKIGDVNSWLDISKITNLLNEYNQIGEKCINCPIKNLCPVCYRMLMDENGKVDKKQLQICDNIIHQYREAFKDIYSFMENGIDVNRVFLTKKIN